jgi:hypothetical protein
MEGGEVSEKDLEEVNEDKKREKLKNSAYLFVSNMKFENRPSPLL